MAFSISDLLSYFSQAGVDPQAAVAAVQSGALSEPTSAGAGRGSVNPAMVDPNAPRPAAPRAAGAGRGSVNPPAIGPGALSPLPVVEIPNQPGVAQAYAGDAPSYENPALSQVAQMPNPNSRGAEQPGILSKVGGYLNQQFGFDQPDFLSRLGNGLAVAGSQDPYKALMMLRAQEAEEAKLREARRKANEPKFTPLKDGAFMMVEVPGASPQVLPIEAVQKYGKEITDAKSLADLQRQLAVAKASVEGKTQFETFKGLVDAAGGPNASATYNPDVQTQVGQAKAAIDFFKNGGDTVNLGVTQLNSPVARDLFDRTLGRAFGSDAAAAREQMNYLLGAEVLSDVGKMKGALSDADREYLKSIRPKTDSPTELKINYLNELVARMDRRETSRIEAATKRDQMIGSNTAPTTAAPAGGQAAPAARPQTNPAVESA